MEEDQIRQLIQMYVEGWRTGDADMIIQPLVEDCEIIESHGPTYGGADKVRRLVITRIVLEKSSDFVQETQQSWTMRTSKIY